MEGGSRRQRWINHSHRKPPQSSWHSKTVPSWEKDFCKVVGSFDWYTLVQMKKYMHFYDNVISWNDSAGEEAFHNAKRRYWAEIKGIQCDAPLPDPDLYIQNIDWNTEIAPDALDDLDSMPTSPESGHEPVVIFGDMFYANHGFSPTGWGDTENSKLLGDNNYGDSCGQYLNWGESCHKNVTATGWTDSNDNKKNYCGDSLGKKFGWGDSCGNNKSYTRDGDDKKAWKYSNGDGVGRTPWDGGWSGNDWGWLHEHNDRNNFVGPDVGEGRGYGGWGYENPRVQAYGDRKNHTWRGDKGRHNRGSYNRGKQDRQAGLREQGLSNSCQPVGQRAVVRVGEAWNGRNGPPE